MHAQGRKTSEVKGFGSSAARDCSSSSINNAITSAAAGTVLKAWIASAGTENTCYPNPVEPAADGNSVHPYVPPPGQGCVTIGGEVNKVSIMYSLPHSYHSCMSCW